MEFDSNKPIYLQIADSICNRILHGELKGEDRIPSVREFGARIGVNPNTVARTYDTLTDQGVIYNKRGIGFFVTEDAAANIRREAKELFLKEELPAFAKKAQLLGVSKEDIIKQL
jgi:DNA-binding transcriptional regulator YhcF (GntR family)